MLLDITRLRRRSGPFQMTGIDRVELAYARRFVTEGEAEACVRAGGRLRVVPRAEAVDFLASVEARWAEARLRPLDPAFAVFAERVGAAVPSVPTGRPTEPTRGGPLARLWEASATRRRWPLARRTAAGRPYLLVSHGGLDRPDEMRRIVTDLALAPLILIHDLIPITHPEYARAEHQGLHAVRMRTAAQLAAAILANSAVTRDDFLRWAAADRITCPEITVAPLGIDPIFRRPHAPLSAARPYFVCLGTIEPRKNHLLLLHLWRDLAAELGEDCPHLVLIGRRGWENEQIVDMLDRCPALRGVVHEMNGLSDDLLCSLMAGARALLFPSFVEGYGLPLAEAAALGVPAVVSTCAAFREIAPGLPDRLDPLDGPAWRRAVLDFTAPGSERRARAVAALAAGVAVTDWATHFAIVEARLAALGASPA